MQYILAFDVEIVRKALRDIQHLAEDGIDYLEKIIQVQFNLPIPRHDAVVKLFCSNLDEIIKDLPDEQFDNRKWSMNLPAIRPFLNTIRDANRILSLVRLKYPLLKSNVDLVDFITLTTLEVFEPTVYSLLPFYKKYLCGNFDFYQADGDQKKVKIQEICDILLHGLDVQKSRVLIILVTLFPIVYEAMEREKLGTYTRFREDNKYAARVGSIHNDSFFDIFFRLSLEDAFSLQTARDMISTSTKEVFQAYLLRMNERGFLLDFMRCLLANYMDINER